MFILNSMQYLIIMILVLINVAFITLLERKILGYSQLRLGPNKASLIGLTQPFSDAIKLFLKQSIIPNNSNSYLYLLSPMMAMLVTLLIWSVIPFKFSIFFSSLSIILFIMILSLGVYPLLLAGWSSNNKYSMVGSLRGVAQTISYEISLSLLIISMMMLSSSVSFESFIQSSKSLCVIFLIFPLFMMWILSMMAESNRTPFDFAEGESELVSGFNIEYMAGGFALIFMAEYGMIFLLASMSVSLFFSLSAFSLIHSSLSSLLVFFWVWTRTTYPRYRYDLLMNLAWKSLLPLVLMYMFFVLGMITL